MRDLIDIVEAKKPTPQPINTSVKYQALYDKTKNFSQKNRLPLGIQWDNEWINIVLAEFNKNKNAFYAEQKSEKEEAEEYGETFVPGKFDAKWELENALSFFWQREKHILDDMKMSLQHRENDYFEHKPDVEDSDQIRLFSEEKDFINGLILSTFDTIDGMKNFVNKLGWFCDAIMHNTDNIAWGECSRETERFIEKAIPLILWYCKLMAKS
jgi:hypothetical protein